VHAVSVSGLMHNPAQALLQARSGPVVVLNRNNPDAVLIGLEENGLLQAPGVRAALTTALFRDGELSLVRAAHVAEMDVASFIAHIGRLGIAATRLTAAETNADLDTLEQWLPSSLPPPIRSSPTPVRLAHLTESLLRQGLWAR
jgi:predicted HTH domain antitoxin